MNTLTAIVLAVALSASSPGGGEELGVHDLAQLSREMTGLLDGYLEAVPECPPREDTPIRLWRMDSAWLRAGAVFEAVMDTATAPAGAGPVAWRAYTRSCGDLLDAYADVMEAYHGGLPDSVGAVRLENGILTACSLYAAREEALLDLLEEEGRI